MGVLMHLPLVSNDKVSPDNVDPNVVRPRTRGDCEGGQRPCPFVSCAHHLYHVAHRADYASDEAHFDALVETCSLDIADESGATLLRIADVLKVTRARAQQIESRAVLKARRAVRLRLKAVALEDWSDGRDDMLTSRVTSDGRTNSSWKTPGTIVAEPPPIDANADDGDAITNAEGALWDLSLDETRERAATASVTMFRAYMNGSITRGFERVDPRFTKALDDVERRLEAVTNGEGHMSEDKTSTASKVRALFESGVTQMEVLVARLGSGERSRISSAVQSMMRQGIIRRIGRGQYALTGTSSAPTTSSSAKAAPAEKAAVGDAQSRLSRAAQNGVQALARVSLDAPHTSDVGIAALERRIETLRAELSGLEQALRIVKGDGRSATT